MDGIAVHVARVRNNYAQIMLSGTVPPAELKLQEVVLNTLNSAGLTANNVLSCTAYCRHTEFEGLIQSSLGSVAEIEFSPLLPAEYDFVLHLLCIRPVK